MEKAKSIDINVRQWQHNKIAAPENLRTTADLFTYSVKNSEDEGGGVAGFAFRWLLNVFSEDLQLIHFASEEMFIEKIKILPSTKLSK